jgi:hypothetical protein
VRAVPAACGFADQAPRICNEGHLVCEAASGGLAAGALQFRDSARASIVAPSSSCADLYPSSRLFIHRNRQQVAEALEQAVPHTVFAFTVQARGCSSPRSRSPCSLPS